MIDLHQIPKLVAQCFRVHIHQKGGISGIFVALGATGSENMEAHSHIWWTSATGPPKFLTVYTKKMQRILHVLGKEMTFVYLQVLSLSISV